MNYFEYFSEIEERFTSRRGSLLLLSTLDWALIESWREAGIPLAAVLRGIDNAFDKHDARKARANGRVGKVNGLAWCAQAVMQATQEMADASVGAHPEQPEPERDGGLGADRVASFLHRNAAALAEFALGSDGKQAAALLDAARLTAERLQALAVEARAGQHAALEELDRTLTALDERLQATLVASLPEKEMVAVRAAADSELAPHRARLGALQLRQIRDQLVQKRLMESRRLPRLSLFYMPLDEGEDHR